MQRRNFVKFLALSPALLSANTLDSRDFHTKSANPNSANLNSENFVLLA